MNGSLKYGSIYALSDRTLTGPMATQSTRQMFTNCEFCSTLFP